MMKKSGPKAEPRGTRQTGVRGGQTIITFYRDDMMWTYCIRYPKHVRAVKGLNDEGE